MNIVRPSFEIMPMPSSTDRLEVLKHLESIGRTCYKSEDKITDESCIKYLQGIRDRKHWAMLEHHVFVLDVPEWIYNEIMCLNEDSTDPTYMMKKHFINVSEYEDEEYRNFLVSGSATAFNYIIESKDCEPGSAFFVIAEYLHYLYPEIIKFPDWVELDTSPEHLNAIANSSDIDVLTQEEIKELPLDTRLIHETMSVKFICDRGVTHELVRHRPVSFAQESTRYCNYSNEKFGNEITVILPFFFDTGMGTESNSLVYDEWKRGCEAAERSYLKLLEYGATPQQARSVLPNSLKSEIIMTANLYEWQHIFDMRAEAHAHPQMQEIMKPLLKECIARDPEVFGSRQYLLEV